MKKSIVMWMALALTGMVCGSEFHLAVGQQAQVKAAKSKVKASSELNELIEIQKGDLPIIISAPHGGHLNIEGSTDRTGEGKAKFVVVRDTYTDILARAMADAIFSRTGKKPHLVIAHFARRHADANRPAKDAYENPSAGRVYDAYHAALKAATEDVQARFGRGIVIDIHGQAAERTTIFRGTQNRATVKHLLKTDGEAGFSGKNSVLGQLVERGYVIKPAPSDEGPEDGRYNGGYITQTYGSKNGGSIDGIQLEFGAIPRSPDQYRKTAADLADSVLVYAESYLGLKNKAVKAVEPAVQGVP